MVEAERPRPTGDCGPWCVWALAADSISFDLVGLSGAMQTWKYAPQRSLWELSLKKVVLTVTEK